MADSFWAG